MVVFFVFNDVLEDSDGAFVAQFLKLAAVVGDVSAFFNLQAPEGHAHAAGAVGQRVSLAAGVAGIDRLWPAQLNNAAMPQGCVLPLGSGKVAQNLSADRVGIAVSKGQIGVVTLHLCLPVALQGRENLLYFGAAQGFFRHTFLLASNPYLLLRL